MKLIMGLGNPGPRYAATRHNIGFRVVDEIARRRGVGFRQPDSCPWLEATLAGGILLMKPLTYMNRSGEALLQWAAGESLPESAAEAETEVPAPLVVCDDLALPLGSVRLRVRGSDGGQKGLASILDAMPGRDIPRLRLGIAPRGAEVPPEEWADYVLDGFAAGEEEIVAEVVDRAATAVLHALEHGVEDAASRFNRRWRPDPEQETEISGD